MNESDAQKNLDLVTQVQQRAAGRGALVVTAAVAALVIATAVAIDLEMIWLLGLVALGFVGLAAARPLRLRLDWSDRLGVGLLALTGIATLAVYLLVQQLARSLDWPAPNTISALGATILIFAAGLPVLTRLAVQRPSSQTSRSSDLV